MARLIKYPVAVAILMGILSQPLAGKELEVETPQQLIALFYENLFSEVPPSKLPELFAEPKSFASALKYPSIEGVMDEAEASRAVWEYFRMNKRLFSFDGIEESKTVTKGRLNYCFIAFSNPSTFFDGIFCVELTAPLTKGGKDGVFKQIRFPLRKKDNPSGPRFLIEESMISINGVTIDPTHEYERTGNLYQQFGFRSPGER